jgi:hypothetical protein
MNKNYCKRCKDIHSSDGTCKYCACDIIISKNYSQTLPTNLSEISPWANIPYLDKYSDITLNELANRLGMLEDILLRMVRANTLPNELKEYVNDFTLN